jgi:hypothetical protein
MSLIRQIIDSRQLGDLQTFMDRDDLIQSVQGVRDSVRAQLAELRLARRDVARCRFVLHDVRGVAACYAMTGLADYAAQCADTLSSDEVGEKGLSLAQIQRLADLAEFCADLILARLDGPAPLGGDAAQARFASAA